MTAMALLRRGVVPGALAGIAGGLVFGAAMISVGTLPSVASIVRSHSAPVGFALHMVIAAIIGAIFGLLVVNQRARASETLFWGLIYGSFWWFLGPQTLLPILAGKPVAWDLARGQALLPSLIGHLFYGAVTATVFAMLRRDAAPATRRAWLGEILRGLASGIIVIAVLYLASDVVAQGAIRRLALTAVLAGVCYPLLFTTRQEPTGPALIRGTAYGFLWWIVGVLTVPPLLHGHPLGWSHASVLPATSQLPAHLLLGAGIAAVFSRLSALSRVIFVDDIRAFDRRPSGSRELRAIGSGAVAGLAGGLLFTVVMVFVGQLPVVARLVGARSAVTGLIVHLVIAQIIGVSYAILFRRRSYDLASGIGWGISYGFFWWVFGALSLLPLFLGAPLRWNATAMSAAFPSLVGHLVYGAALGAVYFLLESRANPWWVTRTQVEADRVAIQREQTFGSAPALWGLTAVIALVLPLFVRA
jgi:uncharacterized membrane protein YagU involved in acid resistance